MERHNPVNPKQMVNNRRENTMRIRGMGATPSMGLSEFRGGNLLDDLKNLKAVSAKRKAERLAGGAFKFNTSYPTGMPTSVKPLPGETRRGGSIGRRAEPSKLVRAEASEAHQMGHALGKHLASLHGGSYHKQFCDGMMEGGGLWDSIKNLGSKVANEFTNPNSVMRTKVGHEFSDPNSVLRGEVIPIGAKVAQVAQPFLDAGVPGLGTAVNMGFKAANYANEGAKMAGYGKTGAYEGMGMRKQKRAPAGANDGRRKRAEIVRRVMSEKGMKMIEASKYVKEHGLY